MTYRWNSPGCHHDSLQHSFHAPPGLPPQRSAIGTDQGYYTLTVKQKGGVTIPLRLYAKLYHYIQMYRAEVMEEDSYLFKGRAWNGNSRRGSHCLPSRSTT